MQPPPTLHMGLHLTREPHVLLRFCLVQYSSRQPSFLPTGTGGQIRAPLLRSYVSKPLRFRGSFRVEARGSHYTTPRFLRMMPTLLMGASLETCRTVISLGSPYYTGPYRTHSIAQQHAHHTHVRSFDIWLDALARPRATLCSGAIAGDDLRFPFFGRYVPLRILEALTVLLLYGTIVLGRTDLIAAYGSSESTLRSKLPPKARRNVEDSDVHRV